MNCLAKARAEKKLCYSYSFPVLKRYHKAYQESNFYRFLLKIFNGPA
jgi:hypothetical protein